MLRQRPFLVEALTAAALIAAPFVLPYLGFTPTTINRILVWGMFGLGFDILFGFTGLLSFGQSAFFGTGGMVAAYLLTIVNFPYVVPSLFVGMIASAVVGYLVGSIALRRTGIYFAMITVAIAEIFYFVEFNPLSAYTGGENGLPGVPSPSLYLGFTTINFNTDWTLYSFLAFWYFVGTVLAVRIVRSPVGAVLRAIRDNPLRAAAVGHNIHSYKLTAFVIAAAYAGFAGGLLGLMQGFMPPDAFTFDTSGQLVMQTAIGGTGLLFGPLVGAIVWLYLQDFLQTTLHLGASWKLVLGLVFVLLICFLRRGLIGGIEDLYNYFASRGMKKAEPQAGAPIPGVTAEEEQKAAEAALARAPDVVAMPARHRETDRKSGPILQATGLTKHYGGVLANTDINFTINHGELRGIIGPNGAGKTSVLNCVSGIYRSGGRIAFRGTGIAGKKPHEIARLGLARTFQHSELFPQMSVLDNLLTGRHTRIKTNPLAEMLFLPSVRREEARHREAIERIIAFVELERYRHARVSGLSFGTQKLVGFARALALEPTLIMLDEPSAGLSPKFQGAVWERIEQVRATNVAVLVVEQNTRETLRHAQWAYVLVLGQNRLDGRGQDLLHNDEVVNLYVGVLS